MRLEMAASSPRPLATIFLRGRQLLVLDVIAITLSFVFSLALRFDAPSPRFGDFLSAYVWVIPILIVTRVSAFIALRLYQRVWGYASIDELVAVTLAVIGSSIAAYMAVFVVISFAADPTYRELGFPRSVAIIDSMLVLAFAGSWRFALRVLGARRVGPRATAGGDRALVIGEGQAAIATLRELRAHPELGLAPVGMLTDEIPSGQRILNIPVLGGTADLARVAPEANATVALFALPSAEGRVLRRLVREAESIGVRCLTVPSIAEVVSGRVTTGSLRDVELEDLLRRAPARIDVASVSSLFRDKTILVTGAGGSIGGELSRQLYQLRPRRLLLLGRGEYSLFETLRSLPKDGGVDVRPVLLDIRDAKRLDALFERERPEVVFHAAAHKHVHFMELFPEEAVSVNVIGTANVLAAAARCGTDRFVLISTDKAVNPTSVMGVSKRVSELLVRETASRTRSRFVNVRFGNVLSSRGSVVPIFRSQLKEGGPLTVTDPEATRYFMTIPEAVQLVLQAAALAEPGDTFVLDMGEPVRIAQLAQDLVELHGMEVGKDVDIQYVGLGPGEKKVEELYARDEHAAPTSHEAVRRISSSAPVPSHLTDDVADLERLAASGDAGGIVRVLQRIVPEFTPNPERSEAFARSGGR